MKNFLAQLLISFNLDLCSGRNSINTLCKKPPRQLLRYYNPGCDFTGRARYKSPCTQSFGETPLATALAGNLYQHRRSDGCVDLPKQMWQPPEEAIKNRMIEFWRQNTLAGSSPNESAADDASVLSIHELCQTNSTMSTDPPS